MHQYTPFINTSAYFMQKYGDSLDLADNKVSPIYLCNLKMHGIYAFNSCQSISYHYCFVSNTNVYWNCSSSLHYDEIFYWFFLYFLKFITVAYKPYKHAIMFLINYFFRVKFAYNENGRDVLKKIEIGINFSAHSIIQCTRNLHSVIFQYYIL